jgi:TetR/AcrR family transcriptional repressor of nem operon
LERYLDCTTRDRLQRLESSCAPKEAIRKFFAEIIEHSLRDPDHKGCFLVNSALDVAPHQVDLGIIIAEQFETIEAFFKRCILGAQSAGTVPRDIDAADTARLFLGILVGIRVLVRTRPKRALLEGMVRPALGLLDKRRSGRK